MWWYAVVIFIVAHYSSFKAYHEQCIFVQQR
jgi:hypothetical protein